MVALCILSTPWLILEKISLWRLIRENLPIFFLTLPFWAFFISLGYTENFGAGTKFIYRELNLLALPLLVIVHQDFLKQYAKEILAAFIFSVSFSALITVILYALPEESSIAFAEFPLSKFLGVKPYQQLSLREAFGVYSPFMVRIQFSNLIALACLSLLWLYSQKFYRLYLIAVFALLLFTTAILGGRGGQLGLLIALGIWVLGWYFIILHPRLKTKITNWGSYGLLGIILLSGFVIAPYILYRNVPAVNERYNQLIWELKLYDNGDYVNHDYVHFTSLRRIISYQNSWELIQNHPVLGVGVGDYVQKMTSIYQKNHPEFPINSHSHLLFLWANAGILAIGAFLFSTLYWLITFYKNSTSWTRIFGLSLLAFFMSIMMLEAMINQVDLMAFGLFLGVCYKLSTSQY